MKPDDVKKIQNLDRELVWHPFTQMQDYMVEQPLVIERGEGVYLYDVEGKRYLDGVSSLWVNVHGHQCAEIDAAIQGQLKKIAHSTLLGIANVPSIQLAEKLVALTPDLLCKVFYSDSGSTSVEIAIKMAFQYWKQVGQPEKQKFITLENAYHGDTVGSVSVGGMELFHSIFQPLLFDSYVIPNFSLSTARELFIKHASKLAACIIEPMVQGAAGMQLQPAGFMHGIRELCDEFDVLLIVDEVATGFGRTGKMFAIEHDRVTPDFLCLAKGITAGYLPLAATLTTDRVFQAFSGSYTDFKTFFHGHTYTGNPLACAAALANLEIFERDATIKNLQNKIAFLAEELKRFGGHSQVKAVRQLGMMVGIELIADKQNGHPYPVEQRVANQVCLAARKREVLLRPLGDVIVLMPPLSINEQEIHFLVEALWASLNEVTTV